MGSVCWAHVVQKAMVHGNEGARAWFSCFSPDFLVFFFYFLGFSFFWCSFFLVYCIYEAHSIGALHRQHKVCFPWWITTKPEREKGRCGLTRSNVLSSRVSTGVLHGKHTVCLMW